MKRTIEVDVEVEVTDILDALDGLVILDLVRIAKASARLVLDSDPDLMRCFRPFAADSDIVSVLRQCADAIEGKSGETVG